MANENAKVRIRMYRQGLGDCFLLTFLKGGKNEEDVHILIDCGTLGHAKQENAAGEETKKKVEMTEVINDIAATTNHHLHLLVITHEHKDHISGFNKSGQEIFRNFEVDHLWLAWTEDPDDDLAQSIKRYERDLRLSLLETIQTLSTNAAASEEEKTALLGIASSTRALLSFSLDDDNALAAREEDFANRVNEWMDYASHQLTKVKGESPEKSILLSPTYLWPRKEEKGKPERGPILELDSLPGWRFFVLGPPYHPEKINRLDTDKDGVLYHLSERLAGDLATNVAFFESNLSAADYRDCPPLANNLEARQKFESGFPFDARFRIEKGEKHSRKKYNRLAKEYESENWRRIDYDWLASIGDLALQLDNSTNNTSLVLAIESIKDGRVLLFPGDAQLGNWETWDGSVEEKGKYALRDRDGNDKEVEYQYPIEFKRGNTIIATSTELLGRTVFYKVGHHASHNATTVRGLETMNKQANKLKEKNPDLDTDFVAMIPVDSARAEKFGWTMPKPGLYEQLLRETNGCVLRADTEWPNADLYPEEKPDSWTQHDWETISKIKEGIGKPEIKTGMKSKQQQVVIDRLYIDYFLL